MIMEKQKLYFKSVDDEICAPLESHLADAKWDDCNEITLFEAVPDHDTQHVIWCTHLLACVERPQCTKAECEYYTSKSGRGACLHRGQLYTHGEAHTFQVTEEVDDDAWLFH